MGSSTAIAQRIAISLMLAALFFFTLAVDLEQLEAEAQHSFLAEVFTDAFSQDFAQASAADTELMDAQARTTDKRSEFFIVGMVCVAFCAVCHPSKTIHYRIVIDTQHHSILDRVEKDLKVGPQKTVPVQATSLGDAGNLC